MTEQVHAQSLNEVLARTYETSPALEAARAQLRAADEGLPIALANFRPTVQITAGYSGSRRDDTGGLPEQNALLSGQFVGGTYGVTITEPLYRGGRTVASANQATAVINSTRAQLLATEEQVFLDSITSYLDVLRDDAVLEFSVRSEHALLDELNAVRAKSRAGALSQLDVAQAEAGYQNSILQRHNAEVVAAESRATFEGRVGMPAVQLRLPNQFPKLLDSEDALIAAALLFNQGLIQARRDRDAAEDNVDVLVGQSRPQVNAVISAQHDQGFSFVGERRNEISATIRFTLNLYSGGSLEAQVRQAKDAANARAFQIVKVEDQVRSDVHIAWSQIQTTVPLAAAHAQIIALEQALEGTKRQELVGERTTLDVVNADRDLFQAQVALTKLQHDDTLARYKILQAVGALTADALGLPVKIYDPNEHYLAVKGRWFGFSN